MKSVMEYFQETYGVVIQHTQLPCLQVGNQQRPNYLPMEVSSLLFHILPSDDSNIELIPCQLFRYARLWKARGTPRG